MAATGHGGEATGGVQRLSPLRTLNQYGEAPRTWAAVGGADPTAHWQQCRQPSAYSAMTSCSQLAAAVVLGLAVGVASARQRRWRASSRSSRALAARRRIF